MSKTLNMVGGGAQGLFASIFATGVSQSDTVTLTTPSGKVKSGKWTSRPNPAAHGLPAEYQEVECIRSSGTQYIDTLLKPDNNYSVKMWARNYSPSGSYCLFGVDTSWNSSGFSVHTVSGEWGSSEITHSLIESTSFHEIELKAGTIYLDGESIGSVSNSTFSTAYNLVLFALNRGGTIREYSELEICWCEIRNGDTLVRNFYPCYIKSTGEAGLYDLVSNAFFANAGSGSFSVGLDISASFDGFLFEKLGEYGNYTITANNGEKTVTETVEVSAVELYTVELTYARLPVEYQEVEYIESSGTQYIDTGVSQQLPIKCEVDVEFTFLNYSERYIVTGSIYSVAATRCYAIMVDGNTGNLDLEVANSYIGRTIRPVVGERYAIKSDIKSGEQIFDVNGTVETGSVALSWSTTQHMYLFACSDNDSSDSPFSHMIGRIRSAKYYIGNPYTMVRDFVPCYEKATGAGGLYDLVTKTFYMNNGSGDFVIGPYV